MKRVIFINCGSFSVRNMSDLTSGFPATGSLICTNILKRTQHSWSDAFYIHVSDDFEKYFCTYSVKYFINSPTKYHFLETLWWQAHYHFVTKVQFKGYCLMWSQWWMKSLFCSAINWYKNDIDYLQTYDIFDLLIGPLELMSMTFSSKYNNFHSRKCVWKRHLENDCHFVSDWM